MQVTVMAKAVSFFFWHFSLLLVYMASQAQAECLVNIAQGAVRGSVMTSLHGRDFCSYRGIPYAEPPVGELRFRAPLPGGPWTGELNATEDGNPCSQGFLSFYFGSEDCLYLNVYTSQSTAELLPVMVFIHGGAYILGNNRAPNYGPHYLLDKDIILVVINYRLGVLGFLSTGDDAAPGNFGLKDQAEALRWVQKNIEAFGGDSNRVTIFGESAGAMSAHFHILSPVSKGLFQAAISESGSALMPLTFRATGMLSQAERLADAVGCPKENTEELISCLRTVDVNTLMKNQPDDCHEQPGNLQLFLCLYDMFWRPVLEVKTAENPEPFLTAPPQEVIKSGDFNRVPLLLGSNSHEGSLFLLPFVSTQAGIDYLNDHLDDVGRVAFFLHESVPQDNISDTWKKVVDFYLDGDRIITPATVHNIIDAATDRFMQHNVQKSVELHLKSGHDKIYLYNLRYRGKYSALSNARYGETQYDLGVVHIDEMEFILSSSLMADRWQPSHPDLETVEAVVTLWTNFATHWNPTPDAKSAPQGVVWPTAGANKNTLVYYVLDHAPAEPIYGIKPLHISVVPDKFKDRIDFWDSLPLRENQEE
ncbi:venom carboxylesterase-6-like [Zootermopsis nevadensis]|uniref:venom carboxylesterase-6-like n=1 Tax=Zootermopsis nevadensis TaxID=136037 RepID=UPI000B8ED168|nr:venom carboxylesterase-6-like [Zootermopsis nevadensis]